MSFFEKICFCFCNKAGTVPLEEEGENQLETGIRRKDISANDEDLFPQKLYRPDEINVIKYVWRYY